MLKLSDENNRARKRAQDQQELLIAELNHRVRNILNLIRGLVSQGSNGSSSVDQYQDVLDARIHALARAHDQLTDKEWGWVSLRSLIETELQAFLVEKANRVQITGDEVDLSPTAFTTLALLMHELVTNSARYGSLTDGSGTVEIDIRLQADGTAKIKWRERNGPPVQAPERRGFGTTIIERSVPFELRGTADVRFKMTGFEADFMIPAKHVKPSVVLPQKEAAKVAQVAKSVSISGQAMVLEDNMIIALDASDILSELGADHVFSASNVADALKILKAHEVDFALCDLNLGEETSVSVIETLREKGVMTVLATGYGASNELTEKFPGLPILRKPYTIETVRMLLSEIDG